MIEHGEHVSFRDLQNYTTLKRILHIRKYDYRFRDLQNYTTLKRPTTI